MHIIIFGVGAVGGFYGLQLAKFLEENPGTFKLSFIARGETLAALQTGNASLTLKDKIKDELVENTFTVKKINAYSSYSELNIDTNELTVILLCTKSKDTISAANDIKAKLTENTVVVSVQNGVENEERLTSVLGARHVIGATTNVGARVLAPGKYFNQGDVSLVIGELDLPSSERLQAIYDLMKKVGLNISCSQEIMIRLWSKLVWNAGFNPTSVLYEMTTGEMLSKPEIRREIAKIMQEVKAVAEAQGYKLRDDIDQKHLIHTDTPEWHDFKTSSLQDYERGRPIEIEELIGIIVRRGKEYNIATPIAEDVYRRLQEKLS